MLALPPVRGQPARRQPENVVLHVTQLYGGLLSRDRYYILEENTEPLAKEGSSVNEQFGAVVVAAGNSTRMGGAGSKVFAILGGKPVLRWSLEVLDACPLIGEICVVCREEDMDMAWKAASGLTKPVQVAAGGPQRQDSVWNGVQALDEGWGYLLVHDGARPLVTTEAVEAVCREALRYGAATAAVRSKDTCKLAADDGFVASTPPRERLWAVQTPQAFEREMYLYALRRAQKEGQFCTDDCQLIEWAGGQVKLAEGSYRNLKLTTPEDVAAAQGLLGFGIGQKEGYPMRIGYGYDVHRLATGRRLVLGGVEVPFQMGLLGHSDADVLTHAVADALLGAAALGDIGQHFPDTDPQFSGANSLALLREVCRLVREAGYSIGNIDCTLIAQKPKVSPYTGQMRENLAAACSVEVGQVNVKATTEEGMGFTGAGEGMAASAVCLLAKA